MEKRDDTNYRDLEFHEPQPPDFWEKINQELASQSIWDIVERISTRVRSKLALIVMSEGLLQRILSLVKNN